MTSIAHGRPKTPGPWGRGAAAGAALLAMASAALADCRDLTMEAEPSAIDVVFQEPTLRPAVRSVSQDRLRRIAQGRVAPDVAGLTTAQPEVRTRFQMQVVERGELRCASSVRLDMTFSMQQQVFADRAYAQGSCYGEVIREHEAKHVDINREGFRNMRQAVQSDLDRFRRDLPDGWTSQADLERAARATAEAITDLAFDAFDRWTQPRHARLDTPENYRAESRRCEGR